VETTHIVPDRADQMIVDGSMRHQPPHCAGGAGSLDGFASSLIMRRHLVALAPSSRGEEALEVVNQRMGEGGGDGTEVTCAVTLTILLR